MEPISELYESRVIDSDEAKKLLPEFNNGWGAGVVHKESQLISDRQLSAALKAGENITYPVSAAIVQSFSILFPLLKTRIFGICPL